MLFNTWRCDPETLISIILQTSFLSILRIKININKNKQKKATGHSKLLFIALKDPNILENDINKYSMKISSIYMLVCF